VDPQTLFRDLQWSRVTVVAFLHPNPSPGNRELLRCCFLSQAPARHLNRGASHSYVIRPHLASASAVTLHGPIHDSLIALPCLARSDNQQHVDTIADFELWVSHDSPPYALFARWSE
jgi:hypothetical protein